MRAQYLERISERPSPNDFDGIPDLWRERALAYRSWCQSEFKTKAQVKKRKIEVAPDDCSCKDTALNLLIAIVTQLY